MPIRNCPRLFLHFSLLLLCISHIYTRFFVPTRTSPYKSGSVFLWVSSLSFFCYVLFSLAHLVDRKCPEGWGQGQRELSTASIRTHKINLPIHGWAQFSQFSRQLFQLSCHSTLDEIECEYKLETWLEFFNIFPFIFNIFRFFPTIHYEKWWGTCKIENV